MFEVMKGDLVENFLVLSVSHYVRIMHMHMHTLIHPYVLHQHSKVFFLKALIICRVHKKSLNNILQENAPGNLNLWNFKMSRLEGNTKLTVQY